MKTTTRRGVIVGVLGLTGGGGSCTGINRAGGVIGVAATTAVAAAGSVGVHTPQGRARGGRGAMAGRSVVAAFQATPATRKDGLRTSSGRLTAPPRGGGGGVGGRVTRGRSETWAHKCNSSGSSRRSSRGSGSRQRPSAVVMDASSESVGGETGRSGRRRRGGMGLPKIVSASGLRAFARRSTKNELNQGTHAAVTAAAVGAGRLAAIDGKRGTLTQDDRVSLSDPAAATSKYISLDVSLDQRVTPQPVNPGLFAFSFSILLLSVVAVLARVPLFLGSARNVLDDALGTGGLGGTVDAIAQKLTGPSGWWGEVAYRKRVMLGRLAAWGDGWKMGWERRFGPEQEQLPSDSWSVCVLEEREKLGPKYIRYRFSLPGPNLVLPLELGQELTLCGLDSNDQATYASFPPISNRSALGYFEVVVERNRENTGTSSQRTFTEMLRKLAVGDELAVKPGRSALVYKGPTDAPVTDVVMISSGLGIVPMLQLTGELLPSRESSVNTATVIWMNEHNEDFTLYDRLESLFYKYNSKLDVSCIIERDLFGHNLASNEQLREAVPPFEMGTMAVVSGPDYFTRKVEEYLTRLGYPENVIVSM